MADRIVESVLSVDIGPDMSLIMHQAARTSATHPGCEQRNCSTVRWPSAAATCNAVLSHHHKPLGE